MIQELKAKAAEYWQTFLPQKWAVLVAEDRVDEELTRVATRAESEIRALMERGVRLDEAEEIVLPETIYLPPEEGETGLGPEIDAELAKKEQDYQDQQIALLKLDPEQNETFIPQHRIR